MPVTTGRRRVYPIATAIAHGAVLFTGDPEITGRSIGCRVEDLRRH
jgi:hypothetical protein